MVLLMGSFMIGLYVALPSTTWKLDAILNTKWFYIFLVVLFRDDSVVFGGAPNLPPMIVGRVLAGAGGNGMNNGVNNLYLMNITEKQRPMYMDGTSVIYHHFL